MTITIGLEQLDRGEGIDSRIVIQQLKDKLQGYREESELVTLNCRPAQIRNRQPF